MSDIYKNTVGAWFKAVTNQKPEPWKEREATDALIEQLTDRVQELMEQNEVLRNANTWLDAALKKAYPNGAQGEVFDLWNKARIELNKLEAK